MPSITLYGVFQFDIRGFHVVAFAIERGRPILCLSFAFGLLAETRNQVVNGKQNFFSGSPITLNETM